MIQPTASLPNPSTPAARRLALLWLVVALLFQGFVIQTHGHIGIDRAGAPTESAGVTSSVVIESRKDAPATPACPLCEERALFGAFLLGGSITITAPIATAYHYADVSLPLLALSQSSHIWQSRAPPIFTA